MLITVQLKISAKFSFILQDYVCADDHSVYIYNHAYMPISSLASSSLLPPTASSHQ